MCSINGVPSYKNCLSAPYKLLLKTLLSHPSLLEQHSKSIRKPSWINKLWGRKMAKKPPPTLTIETGKSGCGKVVHKPKKLGLDIMVEGGIIGAGSVNGVLQGKHFN